MFCYYGQAQCADNETDGFYSWHTLKLMNGKGGPLICLTIMIGVILTIDLIDLPDRADFENLFECLIV